MEANHTFEQLLARVDREIAAEQQAAELQPATTAEGTGAKALRQVLDRQRDEARKQEEAKRRRSRKQELQDQPLPMDTKEAVSVVVARLSTPDGLITSRYDMEVLTAEINRLAMGRDNGHLQGVLAQQIPLVQALSIRYAHEAAVATTQEAQEAFTKLSLRCIDTLVKLAGGIATLRQMDGRGQS